MTYLLDTDTCIYWMKDINSVRNKVREIGWEQICICSITVAELYFGAYNSRRVVENLTRAEDFIQNLRHINDFTRNNPTNSNNFRFVARAL
jgi:tRNA(fMet)-specific endonuclease VapC